MYCSHVFSLSHGASSSIHAIWDPNCISKKRVIISDYFVAVEVIWLNSGLEILFISAYAP